MRSLGKRRGTRMDMGPAEGSLTAAEFRSFELFDAGYRTLCAMLYNYAPMSGHPGGSISSGRIVSSLLFQSMDYDLADPNRDDADVLSYSAGHKALGLYAMWALRTEIARLGCRDLLEPASDPLRLEDLLGFRRNPTHDTPLFHIMGSRPLDGHPTPAIPFVRLATGASGVGVASSIGLALAMDDWFGETAPRVHILEGEGGLTPGRVAEAIAFAGTASLSNVVMHVDWNQASIDSNHVTRDDETRGDYVQWNPCELFQLHDWNVIYVPDGFDFNRILAAQRAALAITNGQPTAIVYRTTKGWHYGIEGRASHGAGHKLCSPAFRAALSIPDDEIPQCDPKATLCDSGSNSGVLERCYWQSLTTLRHWMEAREEMVEVLAGKLVDARARLQASARRSRPFAPVVDDIYAMAEKSALPPELDLKPGTDIALRTQLGRVLGYLNRFSGGAMLIAAADLLDSTSVSEAAKEFAPGFFHCAENPDARSLAIGGICEDAISGVLSGVSSFGRHIGVGSSYGAFLAPLGHIAARLHAIGNQARHDASGAAARPMILICGHAGLKTGEDGPTHADPQPLQLLQENFPSGSAITLTPWDPQEIWPLMQTALRRRPSLIAAFVTRPAERVLDREALDLAPATAATAGVYQLRAAKRRRDGCVVLQESAVTYAFVCEALPMLEREGIDLDVYSIASSELFDLLPAAERERIFPERDAMEAMGITGFTMPTMYRWIRSDLGRAMTMHPYMYARFPGSGPGRAVLKEAGLDGESQFRRIVEYVRALAARASAQHAAIEHHLAM